MIIITGSILTNSENRAAIVAEGIAHSARSRTEPGCLAHNCHFDVEDQDRLVFVEKWADGASVLAHFAVPASGAFIKSVSALATEPPVMQIYQAEEISTKDLMA